MVAIQGIYCYEFHVQNNSRNYTMAKYRSEYIEHQVGDAQDWLKNHGNYTQNWTEQLGMYFDLRSVGAIMQDLVDYTRIHNYHMVNQKLIYDPDKTDVIQTLLENSLPPRSKQILNIIDSITFGEPIPDELHRLLGTWYVFNHRLRHINSKRKSSSKRNVYISENSGDDESYIPGRRPSRYELFLQLHNQN